MQFRDDSLEHNHSYYGMGCPNDYGDDGALGSDIPCTDTGRILKTADNEEQKNGTNYNLQAAIADSGTTISTDNTLAPDTFCPLGWQLPYSGTGGDYYNKSKSWNYLFTTYSIAFGDGTATDATKIKSYPFSYVYSGLFNWGTGKLYNQASIGQYWSSTILNNILAYRLYTYARAIKLSNGNGRIGGVAVRCTLGIINLKAFHGIRVRL